jgi:hypothetical protein
MGKQSNGHPHSRTGNVLIHIIVILHVHRSMCIYIEGTASS